MTIAVDDWCLIKEIEYPRLGFNSFYLGLEKLRVLLVNEKHNPKLRDIWINAFDRLDEKQKQKLTLGSETKKIRKLENIDEVRLKLDSILGNPIDTLLDPAEMESALTKIRSLDFTNLSKGSKFEEKNKIWEDLTSQCPELKRALITLFVHKRNYETNGKKLEGREKWIQDKGAEIAAPFITNLEKFDGKTIEMIPSLINHKENDVLTFEII